MAAPIEQRIPDQYYNNLKWWIISAPPYYCQNASPAGGNDLSTDSVFMGVGMYDSLNTVSYVKTTGIKFAYTWAEVGQNASPALIYWDGAGQSQWAAANNGSISPYADNFYQQYKQPQGVWAIGPNKDQLHFGPYDLDKTTDGTPYPEAEGDLIIIATGSLVLGGTLEEGQSPYGATDSRVFNLLFYSTGSADGTELSGRIPGINQPGVILDDYVETTRLSYIRENHYMVFVAIPTETTAQLMWWPITWDGNSQTVNNTFSLNAS